MTASKILHLSLGNEAIKVVSDAVPPEQLEELPLDLDKLMDPVSPPVSGVIVGTEVGDVNLVEIAQCLNAAYPGLPILMVTEKKIGYGKKDLLKNGFTQVFYLPLEENLLASEIAKILKDSSKKQYVSVKVNDLIDISDLSIDTYVYLPQNDRYVPFNVSGMPLDESKKTKLQEREVTNLYIDEADLPVFYKAYSDSIKNIQISSKLSETQKREVLRSIARDLLSDLYTDTVSGMNTSIKLNQSCKEIILSYLSDSQDVQKWSQKINSTAGEKEDFYNNSSNSMIASVLIGIGLGLDQKNIEALAVAAFLHNIGLSMLPGYLLKMNFADMTLEEKEIFCKHPIHTVDILKEKKVVLPELSQKVIVQQHERFDGSGYPSALKGRQICQEAQILHLVDIILKDIQSTPGKKPITFMESFEKFRTEYYNDPSQCAINPVYLNEISDLIVHKKMISKDDKQIATRKWSMS